jgi:hypothetical protein
MWLKSHHWVDEPYFKTERKRVLDTVRTPTLTVMLFEQKYYNPETRKFDSDKLKTLNSLSLSDMIISDDCHQDQRHLLPRWARSSDHEKSEYDIPYFIPKDNDFDEQIRKEKEEREKDESEEQSEEKIITYLHSNLTIEQYKNAEVLSLEQFNNINLSNIRLKPNEEIIIIDGQPILDEFGNIRIFQR